MEEISRDGMMRIAKRSENMLIKYLGWNDSFCQFVGGGSWKVENCGRSDDEGKLGARFPPIIYKVSGFISAER